MDKKYPIVCAKQISSKWGPTVLQTIWGSESSTIQTSVPKWYNAVVSDDIDKINSHMVSLNLIYKGIYEKSKSSLLAVET